MRLMERIRRHGDKGLKAFLVIFVISVFAGLGVGAFQFGGMQQAQRTATDGLPSTAVLDVAQQETALVVNGRKVDGRRFNELILNFEQMYRGQTDDPLMMLFAYGNAADTIVREEVLLGRAEELKLRVEPKDLAEEKQKIVAQMAPAEEASTGNMLGDMGKKLGARREQAGVFNTALTRMGLTETEWQLRMSREILKRKVQEKISEELNAEADVKAKALRDEIDAKLAGGAKFEDMAREYSDAEGSAPLGGDMQSFLLPGLLPDDTNDQALFATEPGAMTAWFEVPAGYQRWEVYEREPLDTTEYNTARERLVEQVRNLKDDQAYAPTDEELKPLAFKVKARQIMLHRTDPEGSSARLQELYDSATVEINNPYVLAYQALYTDKLQPMPGTGYDQLVTWAKKSAVGEGYNFEAIQGKLDRGKPKAAEAGDDAEAEEETPAVAETPAADPAATEEAPAETADPAVETAADPASADAAVTEDPAAAETPAAPAAEVETDPAAPIYALGVGLLMLALEGDKPVQGAFGQAVIAKVYLDWLNNEAELDRQPIDRDAARAAVETHLARAVESDNYNATLHADRALNLAWLGKTDEALAALEQAEKYAPEQDGGPLATVKETYEKLDMQDKADAIQARMDEARQKQLQQQIQQQMQMQQQQQAAQAAAEADAASGGVPIDIETDDPAATE